MRTLLGLSLVAILLTAPTGSARAVVIDFESLPALPGLSSVDSHAEDGFTLVNSAPTGISFGIWGSSNPHYTGSVALFLNANNTLAILTKDGGGTFGIESIDLAEVLNTDGPVGRTFFGTQLGGGMVTQGFTTDGVFGLETFFFDPSFTNLVELRWGVSGALNVQFDNLVLTPEPSLLALFGLAALWARRK